MICTFEIAMGGIISGWMAITIFAITYTICNNILHLDSRVFTVGPNPEFYILGICINTFPKYATIVLFCFINSAIRAINVNVLHSWIINEVQDVKNTTVINKNQAIALSFVSVIYNWFDFFMYMNILLSQVDMVLVEIFSDLIVTYFLTNYYLRLKWATGYQSLSEDDLLYSANNII